MIKDYELMVIITPDLNEDEAEKQNEAVLDLVKEQGGEVIKTDPWGKRTLAYPINKKKEAHYFVNYLKMETGGVKNVKAQLNINEKILRHMFVARED